MRKDFKVFIFFILLVIIYTASNYFFDIGDLIFTEKYSNIITTYSNFVLGIISLGFFFHKKVTKYSFLLISLGFSFFYIFAGLKGFTLVSKENFIFVKNISLIAFALFLLNDIAFNRLKTIKWLALPLAILIIGYFILKIVDIEIAQDIRLYKNIVGFGLIAAILKLDTEKQSVPVITKRVMMVVALSFFVEILGYFTGH